MAYKENLFKKLGIKILNQKNEPKLFTFLQAKDSRAFYFCH